MRIYENTRFTSLFSVLPSVLASSDLFLCKKGVLKSSDVISLIIIIFFTYTSLLYVCLLMISIFLFPRN